MFGNRGDISEALLRKHVKGKQRRRSRGTPTSCGDNYNIIECGVQISMKEAESRCSSKVDYSETIGNSNHSTAQEGDYGAEAVKFSQDEKNKSRWGWLRKLGLWKKKRTEVALSFERSSYNYVWFYNFCYN
ncbi:unnamed protein product [Arabis nemorensis]|uniref:Uncharacterized protein n=1 Tax=Arabis nemorensis TaxID=586526 RepID=A0A565B0W4_9BRAS|nr:unnamed protein product [Arabis nemorensis]